MKIYHHYYPLLRLSALLTAGCFLYANAAKLHAQTPMTPTPAMDPATHAAHVAAGQHPGPDATKGDAALNEQLSQMQAKVAQLEGTLAKSAPPAVATPAAAGGAAMPGMPAAAPAASPAASMGMDRKPPGGMPGMSSSSAPPPAMGGMSGGSRAGDMMGMMDKMMGMMDKMMSIGGNNPPPAQAGGMSGGGGMMGMDKMAKGDTGGGGAMPAPAPATPMAGGGMGMRDEKMEMAGMMGKGGAKLQDAMPGFPGASHLYHIGATGFFLDHAGHITLTMEQQSGLNKAWEQAMLVKSTADRAVQQAEQELWTLTASDQPDAAKIESKIAEIGKITGDERLSFIRAVGEASKLLTDEQRKALTGFAPPAAASAAMPMPATAPSPAQMAGGMKDM